MRRIAILLTVFNRKEKTLACLRSLFRNLSPKEVSGFDIFLVDDGSTDQTKEAISDSFPEVNIIQGSGNLFWNRGMHKAWTEAYKRKNYDYYLWLNDDTILHNSALVTLLSTSTHYSDKSIIVGTTCALNNPAVVTYGGRDEGGKLILPKKEAVQCKYFNGNIVLIPKYVFQISGMNDPFFRHALGDFDYGLRASKAGVQSIVAPGILGQCDEHHNLSTWCNPEKPFSDRWNAFRSPLGQNPEEFFIYENRHNGFVLACFHYLTNHLRVIWPSLWK